MGNKSHFCNGCAAVWNVFMNIDGVPNLQLAVSCRLTNKTKYVASQLKNNRPVCTALGDKR